MPYGKLVDEDIGIVLLRLRVRHVEVDKSKEVHGCEIEVPVLSPAEKSSRRLLADREGAIVQCPFLEVRLWRDLDFDDEFAFV